MMCLTAANDFVVDYIIMILLCGSLTGSNATTNSNDGFGQMLSGPPAQQPPLSSTSPDFGDFLSTPAPPPPSTSQPIQQQPLLQATPTQILQPQPSTDLMQLNTQQAAVNPQQVRIIK